MLFIAACWLNACQHTTTQSCCQACSPQLMTGHLRGAGMCLTWLDKVNGRSEASWMITSSVPCSSTMAARSDCPANGRDPVSELLETICKTCVGVKTTLHTGYRCS